MGAREAERMAGYRAQWRNEPHNLIVGRVIHSTWDRGLLEAMVKVVCGEEPTQFGFVGDEPGVAGC